MKCAFLRGPPLFRGDSHWAERLLPCIRQWSASAASPPPGPSSCYSSHPNLILHAVKRGNSTPPQNTGRLRHWHLMGEKQTLLQLMQSTRRNEPQVHWESEWRDRGTCCHQVMSSVFEPAVRDKTCTLCQQTDRWEENQLSNLLNQSLCNASNVCCGNQVTAGSQFAGKC